MYMYMEHIQETNNVFKCLRRAVEVREFYVKILKENN